MSRFTRTTRMVVAGLLAVSALTVFGASPASAAPTGSLADDGNGGLVVTYDSPSASDYIVFSVMPSGSTCDASQALGILTNYPSAPQFARLAASPATIAVGSMVLDAQQQGMWSLEAASYTFCLNDFPQLMTTLDQLTMTLGQASPTTTTTTTASPTTTAAAGTPVAPAFTG
ncbi:unannotated protein [freshwater metagenome]|uniref:Unannotated protein n=1 Tax=freshwater metagenome TaxID=449393 RepID=A0A6J6CTH6_9ZZZZ|nr:hypothetical protein [Actinomycetota bacterium]